LFTNLLQEHLRDQIKFSIPSGGLAVWLEWQFPVNLFQLSAYCQQQSLYPTYLIISEQRLQLSDWVMTLEEDEMNKSLQILHDANESLKNNQHII
jgi:GntR family transcriptional regulator/MocR family aminotransferase